MNNQIMDIIIYKLKTGKTISQALKFVYTKRNIAIPFDDETLNVPIKNLNMSQRTTNALMRAHLNTIKDVVEYNEGNKITEIKNFGKVSIIEFFEITLNWCWDHMSLKEKAEFLFDVVDRNSMHVRADLI